MDWGCCPVSRPKGPTWVDKKRLMKLHPMISNDHQFGSPTTKVQVQLVLLSHNAWNLSNFAKHSKHAGDQGLSSRCEVSFARDKET